jgi:hypothetical protein
MAIQVLTMQEIDEVSGGVNGTLIAQGMALTFVSGVAIAIGAISGPVGIALVAVGSTGIAMGGTAMAAGFGDASSVGGTAGRPQKDAQ